MHFVLFGCIWDSLLRYNTQFKTGQTGAKVRAMKSFRNFSQRTHPIHPFGPLPHVSVHLGQFVALQHSVPNGPNLCKSSCHEAASEFFATNAPDPPHWTLHSCLVHFVQFWCIWDRLVDLRNSVQNGRNWYKSSWYEVALQFF